MARLAATPEVASAGMINMVPIRTWGSNYTRINVTGEPEREASFVEVRRVTPEYFATMGIPLRRGRMLTPRDTAQLDRPILINTELARQLFGDEEPVGRRLDIDRGTHIVGVVGDVRVAGPDARPRPTFYLVTNVANDLVIRARTNTTAVVELVRRETQALDPNVSVLRVESMDDIVSRYLGNRRFQVTLISIFAVVALTLGAVGIYGVVAYAVQRQTREIGVRMALGARRQDVLRLIVGRGGRMALLGIGIGLAGAYWLRRYIDSLLFDVSTLDPMVYVGTASLLLGVAVAACWIPAHRAAAVHPSQALLYE